MLRRLLTFALLLAGTAYADSPPDVATYAIVVGSNAGGPGQTNLRFAENDARSVGALLVELGGYPQDRVQVVLHPTPGQLRDTLAQLAERVRADAAAGRQSRVFFYYSGHARSTAIDLGADEIPLTELRQRLLDVPATLTVVVLDACQSGAFARVMGAVTAADFSINSRQHLDASGVAVLASSSGTELSQESDQLRSSYFTHHLLVGLRGAGDANGDGQVSLDEAYRYAYHQTLLSTAETAVGGQHVTFEADLKGHGEVALSFPRAATSAIELPARLEGQAIVEDKRVHAVIAETYKAKGAAVRIAVAPGEYEVIVRHGTTLSRCDVDAGGAVDLERCRNEAIRAATTKGGGFEYPTRIELGVFAGPERKDDYTANLDGFLYAQKDKFLPLTDGFSLVAVRQFHRWLWAGAIASEMVLPDWTKDVAGSNETFSWQAYTLAGVLRAETPAAHSREDLGHLLACYFSLYAQVSAGVGVGRTELSTAEGMTSRETTWGPALGIAAGLHFNAGLTGFGASLGYANDYASVISDDIGNRHAVGGDRLTFALTYRF
jgi:hypothetical protein